MSGGLNRLVVAAAVAAAVLVVPPTTLASGCSGGPSAVQVYKECLPNGGGKAASGGAAGVQPISPQTVKVLKKAGKAGRALNRLAKAYEPPRVLQSSGVTDATEPSAIGSAFNPGSGPTALLIILAGTVAALLAAAGARGWRRSHRT